MGYIGYSLSANAQDSINNYELPVSRICKSIIQDFLKNTVDFTQNEIEQLKKFKIKDWKQATGRIVASSWHHFSKAYNKIDCYNLKDIALNLLDEGKPVSQDKKLGDFYLIKYKEYKGTYPRSIFVGEFNGIAYIKPATYMMDFIDKNGEKRKGKSDGNRYKIIQQIEPSQIDEKIKNLLLNQ